MATIAGPSASNPQSFNGNVEGGPFRLIAMHPTRESAIAPPFTPAPTAARFLDGEFNFRNGRWNAAVGMYRAALDLATKELGAEGGTFFARLDWLHRQNRVTGDIRSWADHVRVEGNGALHDPAEFAKEDASDLRHFTEMFLRYVFEMPGKVMAFREGNAG